MGTMISSACNAMIELLNAEVGFADGDIVLKSPADAGASAKVAMYLFQIEENPHLRNSKSEEVAVNGNGYELRPPPLALDLYYLITPLSTDPARALGHLESIMRVFYDNPVLEPPLLSETMVAAGNEQIRLTPSPLSLEDTNRLWAMFPNKPHYLSATYLLSPVRVPSIKVVPEARVEEKILDIYTLGSRDEAV